MRQSPMYYRDSGTKEHKVDQKVEGEELWPHAALTASGKQATLQRKSSHERMANETFEELQGK